MKPVHEVSNMDSAKFSFPAVKGIQANMEYYVTMVPLDCIPKLFTFKDENLAPEIRSQRTLNKAEVLTLIRNLLIPFEIGKSGIPVNYIVKDWDNIFVDNNTLAVNVFLVPIQEATATVTDIADFFRDIVAGMKFKHLFISGIGLGIPALALLIAKEPYRLKRFVTFLDPWQDMTGDGWQVVQSLYAIGSGGLFGAGLGNSKQKYLYIPEPHNDFIFSILAEELGFVGCAFVLILFGIFIWRGILIAMKAPDMFGSLIAVGITSQVAIQVILNIAVVTSSIPATGVPLPFFSYGGTALFFLLCEMGVLLNISRAGATNK